MTTLTIPLSDQLLNYITSQYSGASLTDFEFLASGFESELHSFRLRRPHHAQKDYILRMFPGDQATKKLIREARGLSLLQNAGFPVPGLLLQETDPNILGMPFEIVEKLDGQALWPILASAEAETAHQLLSRLGVLLAQLHALDWRKFTETPEKYQNNPTILLDEVLSDYRALYTTYNLPGFLHLVDWLDEHQQELSVRPVVVHQDFHANNVLLCADDQLFVIDWTQFGLSDYRLDLCWTLLIMGDLGNVDWGKFILDAYTSEVKEPIEHLDYFHVIATMKLLASTVISATFHPGKLGLRLESVQLTNDQRTIYKRLSQRIQAITGITIPELDRLLKSN